jgi:hypothetical protein
MNESLQPLEIQREALAEQLKLREQWEDQVKALNEAGVLEILPETLDIGIAKDHSLDGADHPIPTFDEIKAGLTAEKIIIRERQAKDGLDLDLLHSNAVTLDHLITCYRNLVLKKYKEGKLFGTDGTPLELDENQPIYVWDKYIGADREDEKGQARLVSYPEKYDKDNHNGKTDQQLIREGRAWEMRPMADTEIPATGQGATQNQERGLDTEHIPLEAGKTSEQYLNDLKMRPNEYGITLKAELFYAIIKLQRDNVVIDDPYADQNDKQGQGKVCFCAGSYYYDTDGSFVPYFYWRRRSSRRRAYLRGLYPSIRLSVFGARSLGENILP